MSEFIGTFIIVLAIILFIRGRKKKKARRTEPRGAQLYALVYVYSGMYIYVHVKECRLYAK